MSFRLDVIHLESSTVCNGHCFMCPHDELNRQGMMDFSLFKKIVDDAKNLGCKVVQPFRLSEPLLFRDLFLWLDYIKKQDLVANIFTNASCLDEDIARRLIEYNNIMMTISFHGHDKETYEKRMGLDFESVKNNVMNFMQNINNPRKMPISIFCLCEQSDEIDLYNELWKELGTDIVVPAIFMEWTGARKVAKTKLDIFKENPDKYKRNPCGFILNSIDVMYDGKVCLCCLDYQGEVIIGDLEYQSLSDTINSRLYQHYIKKHLSGESGDLPLCTDCGANVVEI
jgi:MoaA/NifB/PqqE/SkfB family radical SAM enzyme